MDMITAVDHNYIRIELERELENLRQTRSAVVGGSTTEESDSIVLGVEGERFKLEQVPLDIQFVEGSVKDQAFESVLAFVRHIIY